MTAEPAALGRRMRETRGFVESRLKDLRTLFSAEAVTIRAEVAKHVREITLTPKGRAYIASGTWDLLGAWQHGWCRGPGTNGAPHSLHHQVGSINRSDVARCTLRCKPSSKQHGQPIVALRPV